jgi:hypothetical protein
MKHDLFELSVAVPSKHGNSKIPEYGHKGLTFIEGRRSQSYILKLRNDSAQRVLALVSIDGLNVVDGQPCTPQARGYVVPAYSTVDIEGWRTSLSEVRQFKFETKEQSYVKGTTGEVQNCGVIAAKFFSEKWNPSLLVEALRKQQRVIEEQHHHHHHYHDYPVYPHVRPWRCPSWPDVWYTTSTGAPESTFKPDPTIMRCATNPVELYSCEVGSKTSSLCDESLKSEQEPQVTCAAPAEIPEFKLGTGWGAAKADSVSETVFEREKELCTLTLYYAESADLEKVGIRLAKELAVTPPATPALPQAFTGFCKPPVSQ